LFTVKDENCGRNYPMLEATDAKVYFVHYTREMEEARSRGELRTNSFVRLKKLTAALMGVTDLGDAEQLLTNLLQLGEIARGASNTVSRLLKKAGADGSGDTSALHEGSRSD
jgi:hypothetical protein